MTSGTGGNPRGTINRGQGDSLQPPPRTQLVRSDFVKQNCEAKKGSPGANLKISIVKIKWSRIFWSVSTFLMFLLCIYVNVLFCLGLFTTITAKIQSRIRFGMFKNPEK